MKIKTYVNNEQLIAGITLKDLNELEQNNMALHACEQRENIIQNREKLAAALQCELNHFVCTNQTHSANFYKVTFEDRGLGAKCKETAIADTDALYTYESNVVLCSFAADCVPVVFYDEVRGLVGVIHSGWQGTVKEISRKLLEHLINAEHCMPQHLHVQIGTALSQEKFEVDEDVYRKFKNLRYADDFIYYNDNTNKYHIDNQLVVKKQCELAGIPTTNIVIDRTCTFTNPNGFSYRQNRNSGRHLCFVMKK